MEIKKVLINKVSRQKYVIIPKKSDIVEGDYVELKKVEGGQNGRRR